MGNEGGLFFAYRRHIDAGGPWTPKRLQPFSTPPRREPMLYHFALSLNDLRDYLTLIFSYTSMRSEVVKQLRLVLALSEMLRLCGGPAKGHLHILLGWHQCPRV